MSCTASVLHNWQAWRCRRVSWRPAHCMQRFGASHPFEPWPRAQQLVHWLSLGLGVNFCRCRRSPKRVMPGLDRTASSTAPVGSVTVRARLDRIRDLFCPMSIERNLIKVNSLWVKSGFRLSSAVTAAMSKGFPSRSTQVTALIRRLMHRLATCARWSVPLPPGSFHLPSNTAASRAGRCTARRASG